MESILSAHNVVEKKGNLSKTLTDVQTLIDQLQNTRDAVASTPELTSLHLAKLRQPVKASFDRIEDDLKEVNKGLNQYQKSLKERFKDKDKQALPAGGLGGGDDERERRLVDRAVAMHLLREGKFGVAREFVKEVHERQLAEGHSSLSQDGGAIAEEDGWMQDFSHVDGTLMELDGDGSGMHTTWEDGEVLEEQEQRAGHLQRKFAEMYHILDALRNQHNLGPAIAWAVEHSQELESRGSNLEFELSRLKFVELYTTTTSSDDDDDDNEDSASTSFSGPLRALDYARTVFPTFSPRYTTSTSNLLGSLAFSPSLHSSPYNNLFSTPNDTYASVSTTFQKEFCSMLGLSSTSPLYLATTAGSIALPVLQKLNHILTTTRSSWTSVNELPVETPLPPEYCFHSIFVCPVSKEQATDANPPMMLPGCGHVIAKESLENAARGKTRMKCPYCPVECVVREARRVYI